MRLPTRQPVPLAALKWKPFVRTSVDRYSNLVSMSLSSVTLTDAIPLPHGRGLFDVRLLALTGLVLRMKARL